MLFCALDQSQQPALCDVINENITLDGMFKVKEKVEMSALIPYLKNVINIGDSYL